MRPFVTFLSSFLLALANPAVAQIPDGDAWVEAMNACEALISTQSFDAFNGFEAAQSILKVEPELKRAFQHPDSELVSSAISDGSNWFLCVVTGKMPASGAERGAIIGQVTGTLHAQINMNHDQSVVIADDKTLAPVRVVCHGKGRLTAVFLYFSDDSEFRVAAVNSLPKNTQSPCPD